MPPKPRVPHTPLALTVLSLLDEQPMHPYEMQQLIRERHLDFVIKLKGGSLYDTVERLVAAGLVEPKETIREGRRPERTVYSITEQGQDELHTWLRESLSEPVHEYPQLGAALAFMSHLKPAEAAAMLEHRVLALEAEQAALDHILQYLQRAGLPRLFLLEDEYLRILHQAELEWVRSLVDDIHLGRLAWEPEELRRLIEAGGSIWQQPFAQEVRLSEGSHESQAKANSISSDEMNRSSE